VRGKIFFFEEFFPNQQKKYQISNILNYYVPPSNGTVFSIVDIRGGMRCDTRRERAVKVLKNWLGTVRLAHMRPEPHHLHPYSSPIQFCHLIIPIVHWATRPRHKCILLRTLAALLPRCPIQPKPPSRLVTLHMHPRLNWSYWPAELTRRQIGSASTKNPHATSITVRRLGSLWDVRCEVKAKHRILEGTAIRSRRNTTTELSRTN
jgi:hypothetical protein